MRLIILICATFSLCSCGSTGKLIGGVVRLPVTILKSGMKYHDDGVGLEILTTDHRGTQNLSDID